MTVNTDSKKIEELLTRGVEEVIHIELASKKAHEWETASRKTWD